MIYIQVCIYILHTVESELYTILQKDLQRYLQLLGKKKY